MTNFPSETLNSGCSMFRRETSAVFQRFGSSQKPGVAKYPAVRLCSQEKHGLTSCQKADFESFRSTCFLPMLRRCWAMVNVIVPDRQFERNWTQTDGWFAIVDWRAGTFRKILGVPISVE
jgi:hypothetical protein